MDVRHWTITVFTAAVSLAAPHCRAAAQASVIDRLTKAAQDAANAGKKAVAQEVNRQVNSAVEAAAEQDVAEGSFTAVLSPWSSSDGTKRVELARYSGAAFVVTGATGRQIVVCDTKGVLPWQVTFNVQNSPGARGATGAATGGTALTGRGGGAAPSGRGGTGATGASSTGSRGGAPPANGGGGTSARGGGGTSARGGGSSAGRGGAADTSSSRGGGAAPAKTEPAPSANQRDYRFPSNQVTVTLPAVGARSGNPSQGSLRVGNISETVLAGAAKIRFAQATLPGQAGPQVVDFGVAFKARVLPSGEAPVGCLAPTAGRGTLAGPSSAGRGSATADRGGTANPATNASPAAVPNPGPTFAAGDILTPKIDNVKMLAEAKDSAKVATTVKKGDELVYLGDEQNGFEHVQSATGEGWVKKVLVMKHP